MITMTRMILTRLGTAVLTVVLSATLVFLAVQLLPGDVAQQLLGQDATPEAVEALRVELGLDRPVWERYLGWLVGLFTGDFGNSLVTGSPIGPVLGLRLRNTLMIAIPTFILGLLVTVPYMIPSWTKALAWLAMFRRVPCCRASSSVPTMRVKRAFWRLACLSWAFRLRLL